MSDVEERRGLCSCVCGDRIPFGRGRGAGWGASHHTCNLLAFRPAPFPLLHCRSLAADWTRASLSPLLPKKEAALGVWGVSPRGTVGHKLFHPEAFSSFGDALWRRVGWSRTKPTGLMWYPPCNDLFCYSSQFIRLYFIVIDTKLSRPPPPFFYLL